MRGSEDKDNSGRRKTSKYFATDKPKEEIEKEKVEVPAKRKTRNDGDDFVKPSPSKKVHKVDDYDGDDDEDFVLPDTKKKLVDATPRKKLKSGFGRGAGQKPVDIDESDDDDDDATIKDVVSRSKSGGRGRGGRGASATPSGGRGASAMPSGGRGRGAGRGGFMNFGERKDPPNKGQKVKFDW